MRVVARSESEQQAMQARRNRFGAWLLRYRDVNGVRQSELALQTGLSTNAISRFERGVGLPREETALVLAEATRTDLATLCQLAGLRPPADWRAPRLTEMHLRKMYVDEHLSLEAIASQIGVARDTVALRLRRYGVPIRKPGGMRRYSLVDARPFADPQTDAHSYWLGFLAADGCVFTARMQNVVRLRLKASDHAHVRSFANIIGTSVPVVIRKSGYAEVTYWDPGLVATLARWGIVPAKTLTISFPENLRPQLRPAFVRGYFDGDGSIYWRLRDKWPAITCKFVSGSPALLAGLERVLNRRGIATGRIRPGSGRALVLPVFTARANLQRFSEYLYKDATVWLPRKRAIFEELGCFR